jgi:hypothetical protein
VTVIADFHWSAIRIRDPFATESFAAIGGRDVQWSAGNARTNRWRLSDVSLLPTERCAPMNRPG